MTDAAPSYGTRHWPTDIRVDKAAHTLHVTFDDEAAFVLEAEFLRVHSPSAEVQGHSPEERKLVGGKRHVNITEVTPVGRYAVRIKFDDTHETGIYTWELLRQMGENHDALWQTYEAELAAAGLSRDPA